MEQLRDFEVRVRINTNKRTEEKVFALEGDMTVAEVMVEAERWAQDHLPDYDR